MKNKELILKLWELWENLAETGNLSISPKFLKTYKELNKQIKNISGCGCNYCCTYGSKEQATAESILPKNTEALLGLWKIFEEPKLK